MYFKATLKHVIIATSSEQTDVSTTLSDGLPNHPVLLFKVVLPVVIICTIFGVKILLGLLFC